MQAAEAMANAGSASQGSQGSGAQSKRAKSGAQGGVVARRGDEKGEKDEGREAKRKYKKAALAVEDEGAPADEHEDKESMKIGQLIAPLSKLALRNAQDVRAMTACLWDTYMLKTSSEVVKAAVAEGAKYAAAVEAKGKQHGLGQPHPYVFAAVAEQMLVHRDSATFGVTLGRYLQCVLSERSILEDTVVYFRVKGAYNPEKTKVWICFSALANLKLAGEEQLVGPTLMAKVRAEFGEAMVRDWEAERMRGAPPRGELERVVGSNLRKLRMK